MEEPGAVNFEAFDLEWRQRDDAEQLREMKAQLDATVSSGAEAYEVLWRLARYHHFVAMKSLEKGDRGSARQAYLNGAAEARRGSFLNINRPEASFWLAVNEIEGARLHHPFAALGALRRNLPHLHRVAKDAPTFHFAGALRVLGRIAHQKPKLLGGSASTALEYLDQALKVAPHNSTTRLYRAEALLDAHSTQAAEEELRFIIAQPRDDAWRWEQGRDQIRARQLLEKLRRNAAP